MNNKDDQKEYYAEAREDRFMRRKLGVLCLIILVALVFYYQGG